jgi:hypothetical protein
MLKKMRLRWRVWSRYFNLQPLWLRLTIFACTVILVAASSLSFFFTGPGNPLLPPSWRARLAVAKLAQSVAGQEICHEDCENQRDRWRDMILKDGNQPLYRDLDLAVADSRETSAWRVEALTLLSKAPAEKSPSRPEWTEALTQTDSFDTELAAVAWRLFPERRTELAPLIQSLIASDANEERRVEALRVLSGSPETVPAAWYWSLVEADQSAKIKAMALQALSNFKDKSDVFGKDYGKLVISLWQEPNFPIYCRRYLVMLSNNYASFDKSQAQDLLENLFAAQATDTISKVFLGESLNRYFGQKVSVPDPSPTAWEEYDRLDPLAAPFADSASRSE